MPAANFSFHPENRHTRLQAPISEKTLRYRGSIIHRGAQDMVPIWFGGTAALGVEAPHGRGLTFLPGNALSLMPFFSGLVNLTRADWQDAIISQGAGDINAAPGIAEVPMHRAPADLPGIGASGDTVPSGVPAQLRRVAAGTDWSTLQLVPDVLALPPPQDPDTNIPVDRVISGLRSYPPNAGFGLIFSLDRDFWSIGTFLRFYFGGPTPTTPAGRDGGMFCLTVRGSGVMNLYEHDFNQPDADKWALRTTMRWSGPDRPTYNETFIGITPYAADRIALGATVEEPLLPQILGPLGYAFPRRQSAFMSSCHLDKSDGQIHTQAATGTGIIRVDIRRTARAPFAVVREKYPAQGVWVDAPFSFKRAYPGGTPMFVNLSTYLLPGTSVTAQVYDAATHAPLATPSPGVFLTNAGQRFYYVVFALNASPDRYSSPILFRYSVRVNCIYQEVDLTPASFGIHTHISLTGEDEQGMDHATGMVQITDLLDQMTVLGVRDRLRCYVSTFGDDGSLLTHLGEYETAKSRGSLKGVPTRAYPNPNYRDFNNHLVGLWGRLAEAQASQLYDFSWDPTAPPDPDLHGLQPPWKVSDVVRVLLNDAGFPDDELDLPNASLRFWLPIGTNSNEQYMVQPGQPILPLVEELVHRYLLGAVVRDPNAGPRGMWRIIPKPRKPWGNHLWSFLLRRPAGAAGKLATAAGAWGPSTTWIQKGRYQTYPEAPLANVVIVRGVQHVDGKGDFLIEQPFVHQDSIDNPLSIHYLGREVHFETPADYGITTVDHAVWLGSLLADELCFRRLWVNFIAPLPYVVDPQDPLQVRPRPLRVYDKVFVNELSFLLTSVDYEILPGRGGENQMGVYEGYFEASNA